MGAPSILTDEWLDECNAALSALELPARDSAALVVTERVLGAAPGRDALTLVADDAGVRLSRGDDDRATAWVTLSLADVEALHAGELDPAQSLAAGRVRIRGDLRAVVAASGLLAAAHRALRDR